ncbi:MAG: cupin domain-containing protein [Calditrichaeota bacterium]|jgi:quercetin dioxygenase-like cupin family protein|nr:cupin domain-containing protein [Calditrichota bacterium]MBT7790244.1 cupin domain-containing protein [Calditrichota bacterium]
MKESKSKHFVDIESAPKLVQLEGVTSSILNGFEGETMMIVQTEILPGRSVPEHSHPHEQLGVVKSGRVRLTIGGASKDLEAGDVFAVPPDVPHRADCIGDEPALVLDIFTPVREDFIAGVKG